MKKRKHEKATCVQMLIKAAVKHSVTVEILDDKGDVYLFKKKGKEILVRRHVPDLDGFVPALIVRDKELVKKILRKHHVPVPGGIKKSKLRIALKMLDEGKIKFPLVVKPVLGAEGSAVIADINKRDWFIRAIEEVFQYNKKQLGKPGSFIIEDYIKGDDYRFLVLDGKVLTVLMRKPAYVVGNGKKTISKLIKEYNSQPDIGKTKPLCPIVKDCELERNLKLQGLSEKYIVPKGKKIFLRKNANISTGGRSFECTDKVHPSYKRLAVKVAKILHLRFCAVDLIAANISKYEKFSVIEINNSPGFDIHEKPYRGKPFPVADCLVKSMFK